MDGGPAPAARPGALDRLATVVLLLGLGLLLWRAHVVNVDAPARAQKEALHAAVLENRAPDPYQYKLATISWAVERLHRTTGASRFDLWAGNALVSLLGLLAAHHAWLRAVAGPRGALLGTALLAALAHGLFLDYYHHPYDLWGVAGFCLLLRGLARRAPLPALALGALALGAVWEKHALLPLVLLGTDRAARVPWARALVRAAVLGAASLVGPVTIRLLCGGDRALVDVTPLAAQDWGKIALAHGPYVVPFVVVAAASWRRLPLVVRLGWAYVPAMFLAYAASRFLLYELRSFWAFAPVFTATAAAWSDGLRGTTAGDGPPPPADRAFTSA